MIKNKSKLRLTYNNSKLHEYISWVKEFHSKVDWKEHKKDWNQEIKKNQKFK